MKRWLSLLKTGDWLIVLLSAAAVGFSFPLLWTRGQAERAVIRLDGRIVAEYPLTEARKFAVQGPLGETVIEIQPGRARVLADPGRHQYCVKQGWLTRPNAIALCAPNHVSLTLTGGEPSHDSLNY
ncbi:MAG: NusG domain II-containing protein [Rhodocyclaceae bacterium]|nr:NusG domain II-containing protein [Rhodocyclaceae bacterium]